MLLSRWRLKIASYSKRNQKFWWKFNPLVLPMKTTARSELGQLCLDVAISFVLFLVACVIAGLLQHFVTPEIAWFYTVWFLIGLLPLILYMRHRGICQFDRWDLVAFSPFPIVVLLTRLIVPDHVAPLAGAIVTLILGRFLRKFLPKRQRPTNQPALNHSEL